MPGRPSPVAGERGMVVNAAFTMPGKTRCSTSTKPSLSCCDPAAIRACRETPSAGGATNAVRLLGEQGIGYGQRRQALIFFPALRRLALISQPETREVRSCSTILAVQPRRARLSPKAGPPDAARPNPYACRALPGRSPGLAGGPGGCCVRPALLLPAPGRCPAGPQRQLRRSRPPIRRLLAAADDLAPGAAEHYLARRPGRRPSPQPVRRRGGPPRRPGSPGPWR